ncbi:MAG: OsmC family protein [Acetobacteraceae bacterium]
MSGHRYAVQVEWTGAGDTGTTSYRAYGRDHRVVIAGKPDLLGSSDPTFRGDASRHNPEELLVAAISACHMLWYLHLAAEAGVVVTGYADRAEGEMALEADGGGHFTSVELRPQVTLADGADSATAEALHAMAHAKCFIARSVNFPITVLVQMPGATRTTGAARP